MVQQNRHTTWCICFGKCSFLLIIYDNTKCRLVHGPGVSCQSSSALEKSLNHWPLKFLLRNGAKSWHGFVVKSHFIAWPISQAIMLNALYWNILVQETSCCREIFNKGWQKERQRHVNQRKTVIQKFQCKSNNSSLTKTCCVVPLKIP